MKIFLVGLVIGVLPSCGGFQGDILSVARPSDGIVHVAYLYDGEDPEEQAKECLDAVLGDLVSCTGYSSQNFFYSAKYSNGGFSLFCHEARGLRKKDGEEQLFSNSPDSVVGCSDRVSDRVK